MEFIPGQVVVHPHHGPSTVTGVMARKVQGREVRYVQLEVHHTNLAVSIPESKADEVGVRPLLGADALRGVFSVLTSAGEPLDEQWSRRIKAQHELCRSGDVRTIAGVVRDLTRRDEEKGLSMGEKDLLKDARTPLVAELALCLDISEEIAESAITTAVIEGSVPSLGGRLPLAV